ncbi:MAG: GNAT family N-acetyltransferase [Bacillota bacterium]
MIAVYILKDYQRRGIGRALLDACYKALSSFESIIVWVLESNHDAIRFYESEGFDRDGKSKTVLAQKAIRMVKGN